MNLSYTFSISFDFLTNFLLVRAECWPFRKIYVGKCWNLSKIFFLKDSHYFNNNFFFPSLSNRRQALLMDHKARTLPQMNKEKEEKSPLSSLDQCQLFLSIVILLWEQFGLLLCWAYFWLWLLLVTFTALCWCLLFQLVPLRKYWT